MAIKKSTNLRMGELAKKEGCAERGDDREECTNRRQGDLKYSKLLIMAMGQFGTGE